MNYYLDHIIEREILYNLYGKGKISCILRQYYGSHLTPEENRSRYFYCYTQEVIENEKNNRSI